MSEQNRFCFCAVVKDEGPVIERCLTSIQHLADRYLICDTGSTDDTVEKIQNFMKKAQIPGEVIFKEWQSYGFNKSYLLWKLQNTEPYKSCKYICWLDADEVFLTKIEDKKSYPTKEDVNKLYEELEKCSEPVCMFKTHYSTLEYWRWQIARNNQPYFWKLPYQEYFCATENGRCAKLNSLINYSRHEGNSSRDPEITLKRIKMAEDWLEKNSDTVDEEGFSWDGPKDGDLPRFYFYLAEAYQGINKEKAIELYLKTLDLNGWNQEKYVSRLKLYQLTSDLDHLREAIKISPDRLEAYYYLMTNIKTGHADALNIGLQAPLTRTPSPSHLFTETDIYDWRFDLEFSVICYYAGDYKRSYEFCKQLLDRKTYPEHLYERIQGNFKFAQDKYTPQLTASNFNLDEPLPTVLIIDNFYPNPDEIRTYALKQDFGITGNYPGGRTKSYFPEGIKDRWERIIGRKITYWPDSYNGSFQLITQDKKSWIHRDRTDFSALVFLTPNPPAQGGTFLCRHKATGLERALNDEEEALLNKDTHNLDAWKIVDRIGNKYNRAVIFQGRNNHQNDLYFGTDLESGRLFHAYFFNVEGRKY